MDGRVDVRAAVFRSAVAIGRVEIALVRVGVEFRFEYELLGRRPVERIRGKIVGEVNPLAVREGGVGGGQVDDASERQTATQVWEQKRSFHGPILIGPAAGSNVRG